MEICDGIRSVILSRSSQTSRTTLISMRLKVSVLVLLFAVGIFARAQLSPPISPAQEAQAREYWIDPATGLMWAAKDNGKDVSWRGAIKYCRNLRLAGYSDWRLANMFELQPLFDKTVESPGRAGTGKGRMVTWHVKGSIFLTGNQWANNYRTDDRGHNSGYEYYFDFNEGKSNDQPSGWLYSSSFMRALCIRGSGDPLAGQRLH
jgi:Protein of unknown function (DUF1566)